LVTVSTAYQRPGLIEVIAFSLTQILIMLPASTVASWSTTMKRHLYCSAALIGLVPGCDPYVAQRGEFNAGPVDAANFPLDYKGTGGDPNVHGFQSGRGRIFEINAYVNGSNAGYFRFPFTRVGDGSSGQLDGNNDPIRLLEDGRPYTRAPTPRAYVFDPTPTNPFPLSPKCDAPRGYTYDERYDDVRLDEQGNIFTQLPIATQRPGLSSTFTYIPVVAETALSAAGLACQSIKSEKRLKKAFGDPPGTVTGNYVLWAIIDPSAGVYRVGQDPNYSLADGGFAGPRYATGIGVQKWGWFGQYFLAYIDGGYIPTVPRTVTEGTPPRQKQLLVMKTQPLYFPGDGISDNPTVQCGTPAQGCDPGLRCVSGQCVACSPVTGNPAACSTGQVCDTGKCYRAIAQSGAPFKGYDVLKAKRGDTDYSPVCQLFRYDSRTTGSPQRPLLLSDLPKSELEITGRNPQPVPRTSIDPPPYVYCPQVQ
jgi:hypothetical protein